MNQWFIIQMLKSSLWQFIGRYHDLVNHCRKSVSEITIYMIRLSYCVRDYHIYDPFVVLCQRLPYIWSVCRTVSEITIYDPFVVLCQRLPYIWSVCRTVSEITIYMLCLSYCVRDYHIYDPFVVITISSFLFSFMSGFLTWLTQRLAQVEQQLFIFLRYVQCLVGFVLYNL